MFKDTLFNEMDRWTLAHLCGICMFLYAHTDCDAQKVAGWLNNDRELELTNSQAVTIHVAVLDDRTKVKYSHYLQPGQKFVVPVVINRESRAMEMQVYTQYDSKCYEIDIARVRKVYDQREEQRRNSILLASIVVVIDEVWLNGILGKAASVVQFGSMVLDGATTDEWLTSLSSDVIENTAMREMDDKWMRGAVAAAFELSSWFDKPGYKDLEQYTAHILRLLTSNAMYSSMSVSNLNLTYPIKSAYPNFSVEGNIGLFTRLKHHEEDNLVWLAEARVNGDQLNSFNLLPYKVGGRLSLKYLGIAGGIGQTGFVNTKDSLMTSWKADWYYIGGFVHTYGFASRKTQLGIDAGVYYNLSTLTEYTSSGEKRNAGVELKMPSIALGLSLHFARGWLARGEIESAITSAKEGNEEPDWARFQASVGISLPLFRMTWN